MKKRLEQFNEKVARKLGLVDGEVTYAQVQDAIRDPKNFAQRIDPSNIEISQNVWLASQTVELGGGNFTNVYDLSFDNNNPYFCTEIITRQTPLYPHRLFVNEQNYPKKDTYPVACINGAFFFLQDEILDKVPSEVIYNFNVRAGVIYGLPAVSREVIFATLDGRLHEQKLEAKGIIEINGTKFNWVGGEPIAHKKSFLSDDLVTAEVVLFNSACCTIQYENPADKTSLRKLRKDLNSTPKSESVVDVVVTVDSEGGSCVSAINQGGGTDFFDGNFILQIKKDKIGSIQLGDTVEPKTVDSIYLHEIDSALSTGPSVEHFLQHDDHEMNHDPSLGTFPPFDVSARYARSVIYEDHNGYIHMVVFDAVPRSEFMKGVTPREVAQNIPTNIKWAVFLDGGQSSRLTFGVPITESNDIPFDGRGNRQYVRLNERLKTSQVAGSEDQFLWSTRGRPLSSMIMLRRKK